MKLFQKLIAAPAIISLASGFAVNAAEINSTDLSDYANSNNLVSLGDFKSDTLFPGDWAYDSLKDLTNSPKFNGNSVSRLEAAAELSNLIAGGEGLINGAAINRLSDELGSELAIMKGRVDGLEARVNEFEAGQFSSTTTMNGKAKFQLGMVEAPSASESLQAFYFYEIDLNTSFTGEDKLNVEIETGNNVDSGNVAAITDFGNDSTADVLKVTDLNYTFPLFGASVSVGDSMDASKQFTGACEMENVVDALSDCGTGNSIAVGGDQSISASYEFDNGFSVAAGISALDGETTSGMFTKEGNDIVALNAAYSTDTFAIAIGASQIEASGNKDRNYYGINASFTPDGFPIISGGYEASGSQGSQKSTGQWAVGLGSDLGEGSLSLSYGTNGAITDGASSVYAYDLSYSYPLNDSMSVTPFIFVTESSTASDTTGYGTEFVFKF